MLRLFVILLLICGCYSEEELKAEARDSYLDAYHESHGATGNIVVNKNDRDSYYDGPPEQVYGPPHPGYPEPSFPPTNYGPPVYGPPSHFPMPRYTPFPAPFYGVPHAMMGLLDKLHLNFIALICLLLFIPKFKLPKEGAEMDELDEDSRSMKNEKSNADARLNTLTQFVLESIEKYSGKNSTNNGVTSYARKMLNEIDNKLTYNRLLSMYGINEDS